MDDEASATVKAVSDVASNAPRPIADKTITPSTAVVAPATDVMARRVPWLTEFVMHISIVGPGVTISRKTAATYSR